VGINNVKAYVVVNDVSHELVTSSAECELDIVESGGRDLSIRIFHRKLGVNLSKTAGDEDWSRVAEIAVPSDEFERALAKYFMQARHIRGLMQAFKEDKVGEWLDGDWEPPNVVPVK